MKKIKKLHFLCADTGKAIKAKDKFLEEHKNYPAEKADAIVVLGGDGTMLEALHFLDNKNYNIPVYGINCGSVGFLLNPEKSKNLFDVINQSKSVDIHPLRLTCFDKNNEKHEAIAFNEVSLLRETRQAAKLKVIVDDIKRIEELVCDGILLSTPAGSTAYNLSANGPILPISANLLSLTPISAFRPRRWRGALLPSNSNVKIEVYNPDKRPVSATADSTEFRDVVKVEIHQSEAVSRTLLFDPNHNLGERILKEQFIS